MINNKITEYIKLVRVFKNICKTFWYKYFSSNLLESESERALLPSVMTRWVMGIHLQGFINMSGRKQAWVKQVYRGQDRRVVLGQAWVDDQQTISNKG